MASLNFQALQLANEQRSAYGLRYNDYHRYRKHCANRTHRLRSSLKMTHGKGRDFKKLPALNADNIKDGHLQLLLFEAERAWAYSQELNALALQPPNQHTKLSTLRHTATARFRRAVHWSNQLLSHCKSLHSVSRLSTTSLIQVVIYALILNGRFLRAKEQLEDGLVQLAVARFLLDELAAAGSAGTSRDRALATLFSDEIGPEIRYFAHELGRNRAYDVDAIVGEMAGKHRHQVVDGCDGLVERLKAEGVAASGAVGRRGGRRTLEGLVWEDQPVDVRNPELVDVLLKVQEAEARLDHRGESETIKSGAGSKKSVAAYDAILLALSDAEEVARKMVEARQLTGGATATFASGARDIQFLHAYIVYQLLSRRMQRDLLLIAALFSSQRTPTTKTPGKLQSQQVDGRFYPAVVKLLDTILQSLDQMRTLSLVDESPDLAAAVEARIAHTKAQRCLNLARCYEAVKRYAEALALIQHANLYMRESRAAVLEPESDVISLGDPAYFPLSTVDLARLDTDLAAYGLKLKQDWFAYNGGSIHSDDKAYKKPLFFNVALNYVPLDMDRLEERAGKRKPAPAPVVPVKQQQVAVQPSVAAAVKIPELPTEKRKAKVEEVRPATPEATAPVRGGLSSLLGGWWGRS